MFAERQEMNNAVISPAVHFWEESLRDGESGDGGFGGGDVGGGGGAGAGG